MDMRSRFLKVNIPYDDIDIEMLEIIDILNFKCGIKTEFCCYGHGNGEPTYIAFDKSVHDKDMKKLIKILYENGIEQYYHISKWMRYGPFGLANDWKIRFPGWNIGEKTAANIELYDNNKKEMLKILCEVLKTPYNTI